MLLVLLAGAAMPMQADFAAIARALDEQPGLERVSIPFLGIARALVRVVLPSGIHDFQLATFEGRPKADPHRVQRMLQANVGAGFTPVVQARSRNGEWSFIYAKPSRDGNRVELMVLTSGRRETVLVRVDVDADVVARELDEPRGVVRVAEGKTGGRAAVRRRTRSEFARV